MKSAELFALITAGLTAANDLFGLYLQMMAVANQTPAGAEELTDEQVAQIQALRRQAIEKLGEAVGA